VNARMHSRNVCSYDKAYRIWTDGRKASMSIERSLYYAIKDEVLPSDRTLEFGCGLSTFAFRAARDHTIIESSPQFCGIFEKTIYSPLVDGWYRSAPAGKFRVILIDGPSLAEGGIRSKCIDTVLQCCDESSVIFVDDTDRMDGSVVLFALKARLQASVTTVDRWGKIFGIQASPWMSECQKVC